MKTLDANLAPLSEALGTMMECNEVKESAGCKHFPSPALAPTPISKPPCFGAPFAWFLTLHTNVGDSIFTCCTWPSSDTCSHPCRTRSSGEKVGVHRYNPTTRMLHNLPTACPITWMLFSCRLSCLPSREGSYSTANRGMGSSFSKASRKTPKP